MERTTDFGNLLEDLKHAIDDSFSKFNQFKTDIENKTFCKKGAISDSDIKKMTNVGILLGRYILKLKEFKTELEDARLSSVRQSQLRENPGRKQTDSGIESEGSSHTIIRQSNLPSTELSSINFTSQTEIDVTVGEDVPVQIRGELNRQIPPVQATDDGKSTKRYSSQLHVSEAREHVDDTNTANSITRRENSGESLHPSLPAPTQESETTKTTQAVTSTTRSEDPASCTQERESTRVSYPPVLSQTQGEGDTCTPDVTQGDVEFVTNLGEGNRATLDRQSESIQSRSNRSIRMPEEPEYNV